MPSYSFKNTETGEEWEEFFSISEREKFLEQNPHIQQLPSMVSIVGGLVIELKMIVVGKRICLGLQKHIQCPPLASDDMVRILQRT